MSGTAIQYDISGNPAEGFGLTRLLDYTGGPAGSPKYIGYAQPSSPTTPTSAAIWKIMRLTYTANDLVATEWADGNTKFDNVWDNRAALNYS